MQRLAPGRARARRRRRANGHACSRLCRPARNGRHRYVRRRSDRRCGCPAARSAGVRSARARSAERSLSGRRKRTAKPGEPASGREFQQANIHDKSSPGKPKSTSAICRCGEPGRTLHAVKSDASIGISSHKSGLRFRLQLSMRRGAKRARALSSCAAAGRQRNRRGRTGAASARANDRAGFCRSPAGERHSGETADFVGLDRQSPHVGISAQQRADMRFALLGLQRAGAIDEQPARLGQRDRFVEQLRLQRDKRGQIAEPLGPGDVGMAPDRAGRRAGRIEQDGVERRRIEGQARRRQRFPPRGASVRN